MSYTRRIVSFDRKGRQHVTFRSMGDDSVNCEDETTWRGDPTCQELHPGLYPTAPTAGASNADSTSPGSSFADALSSVATAVKSLATGTPTPAPSSGGGGTTILGVSLPVVAAGAGLAYYLFVHKKRRK